MSCPFCNGGTRVVSDRAVGCGILRRRECYWCQARFRTFERTRRLPGEET